MRCLLLAVVIASSLANRASAQDATNDLSKDSLEQLTQVQIKVSSASRKDEDLWNTPAAVFVISREDIANSSASSIPELLRVVPGLQVAQISASSWAISGRGFNSAFANKLLVLVDGRTMYSEIYSGAHWDTIDLPLSTIERIEVIRGPGAAVWGANAVNGVVNIITRAARSVTTYTARGGVSNINNSLVLQDGISLGERAQGRAYLNYVDRRPFNRVDGTDAFDGESLFHGGVRADWQKDSTDRLTFSGDAYGGHVRQQILSIINLPSGPYGEEHDYTRGGFALSRWEHTGDHGTAELQGYYSNDLRHELDSSADMQTESLEFVDHPRKSSRVDLVTGAELRLTEDSIESPLRVINQSHFFNYLVSGFAEADLTIKPRRLVASLGSKIQDSTLTGFQLQPSARLMWTPDSTQALWIAVSRAVVAPSIQDKAIALPLLLGTYDGLPIDATILGNPNDKPEEVVASEFGYRQRLPRNLTLDLATFYNRTERIQSLTAGTASIVLTGTPHIQDNFTYGSGFKADSEGVEAALSWHPIQRVSVHLGYTWMEARVRQVDSGSISIVDAFTTPRNTVTASLFWQMAHNWSATAALYRIDPLPPTGTDSTQEQTADFSTSGTLVPSYARLDLHISRKINSQTIVEVGATNLLQEKHEEFSSSTTFLQPDYVPRSAYARATWRF